MVLFFSFFLSFAKQCRDFSLSKGNLRRINARLASLSIRSWIRSIGADYFCGFRTGNVLPHVRLVAILRRPSLLHLRRLGLLPQSIDSVHFDPFWLIIDWMNNPLDQ